MSDDQVRLRVEQVGKTYGARRVLRSVSADLQRGDTLLVTGRNGAGKSTLLRIIAGLLRPSHGSVQLWLDGAPIAREHWRRAIGYVAPDMQLYRDLTAREHIRLVARLRGLPGAATLVADALSAVGLAGREDERIGGFSSGMIQRLRYALALMHKPRVLVLDEPTTNLDEAGIAIVSNIVHATRPNGIVIIATNDARDLRYGDLILALDEV